MMSISIDRSRFLDGMRRGSIYDSATGGAFAGDRRFPDEGEEDSVSDSDSCSSTSIGRNSDLSSEDEEEEDSGETEVRSSCKDPLDTMDDLEDVLPVRKGISKFYNGKSKSFTSLADACAASNVKEIVKPENPYTNKRKTLLGFWERNHIHNSRGVSKKLMNYSQSSAGLGTMSSESNSLSSSPSCSRPPLHPRGKRSSCVETCLPESPPFNPMRSSPWRSFSLSDLQSVAAAVISNNEEKVH